MDPGEGTSDPFRRSGRVHRSPVRQKVGSETRLTDPEVEGSEGESRKRKETSPQESATKKRTVTGGGFGSDEDDGTGSEVAEATAATGDYKKKLDLLTAIGNDLVRWASSQYKSKKATLVQKKDVTSKAAELLSIVSSLRMEVSYMDGRLSERLHIEEAISTETGQSEVSGVPTFAEVLKSKEAKVPKITGISRMKTPKVVFVRSADDKQDLEEVKKVIKTSIRPSKLGVNIRRVIKTARGVMIEAEGSEQLERIKSCHELQDKGLVFDKPKRRSPRLMIYDVELPENERDLIEDIYDQNMTGTDIDLESFRTEFKSVHTYKKKDPKDPRVTLVAECTARVRNILRAHDKLYIGWQLCRVKDYNPLVRCFKCQAFGHVAKY